jgi:hypothetical protein
MTMVILLGTWDVFIEHVRSLLSAVASAGLDTGLALVVVIVGWALAVTLSGLVRVILRAVHFNDGVRRMLGESPQALQHEPAQMMAWAVHWGIIVLSLVLAADVLGFELSRAVGDRLRDLMPRLVAATIVLVVGFASAMLLGAVTRRLFESGGFRGSRLRGQIVTIVLTAVAVLLSLEQLGLAAQFILALGLTAAAAVAIAVALAFGLGCRDLARDFVIEYLRSLEEEPRSRS